MSPDINVEQANVANFQVLVRLQLGVWMKVGAEELPIAPPAEEEIIQKSLAGQSLVQLQLLHCYGNGGLTLPQLLHQLAQFRLQLQKVLWQEEVTHEDAGTMQLKQLQQKWGTKLY